MYLLHFEFITWPFSLYAFSISPDMWLHHPNFLYNNNNNDSFLYDQNSLDVHGKLDWQTEPHSENCVTSIMILVSITNTGCYTGYSLLCNESTCGLQKAHIMVLPENQTQD